MGRKSDDYLGAILEDMDDKFDMMLEWMDFMKDLPASVKALEERVGRIELILEPIVPLLREHSLTLRSHDSRLTKLETA